VSLKGSSLLSLGEKNLPSAGEKEDSQKSLKSMRFRPKRNGDCYQERRGDATVVVQEAATRWTRKRGHHLEGRWENGRCLLSKKRRRGRKGETTVTVKGKEKGESPRTFVESHHRNCGRCSRSGRGGFPEKMEKSTPYSGRESDYFISRSLSRSGREESRGSLFSGEGLL